MRKYFPNYDLVLQDKNEEQKIFTDFRQKLIDFEAFAICDFFADMEVLQIYGEESKEYIHAVYFGGRLVGIIYLGTLYSEKELNHIKQKYIPKEWKDIKQYVIDHAGIWYMPLEQKHYAWIYRRILKEVEK